MSWAIVAVAGAGLVGGAMSANAAGDAVDAQTAAADRGVAEQRRQFDQVRELLMPFVNAATGGGGGAGGGQFDGQAYLAANQDVREDRYYFNKPEEHWKDYGQYEGRARPLTAPAFDSAAYLAANPDVAADPYYSAHPEEHWQKVGQAEGRARTLAAPTKGALPAYLDLTGLNGNAAQGAAIADIEGGQQFGHLARQGEDAILQNASATGGLRGGNTQGALADFRSSLLSSLIDKQLGRYGGLVQLGQGSAAGVGTAAMSAGQGISGLMQQAGAAQAGGIVAGSNAITGAIGGIGGMIAGRGGFQPAGGPAATGYGGAGPSGGGGFGSGVIYGNQDLGAYF